MIYIGILAVNGVDLPIEYNINMKTEWFVMVQPGLLLIILFISLVFEDMHTKSLNILELNNKELKFQKDTIATQSIVLEELIEEKNYVIRILAHDLRNPLKNIGGLIEMMKDEKDPVQQAEYVKMIKQSSINAQNLVDKVLEMDATEQNETHLELLPIDAISLLNKVVQSMIKIGKKKQIELQPSNSIDMAMILADEAYLRAVFENLISNAIKFSNTGTKVTVESIIQDGTVQFKVKDEGPGIEPDELDKLFLKFNKLSPRPTAGESSTGLGLYLVKRYVELMKGKVWYDNSASNGATFIVELPLVTT